MAAAKVSTAVSAGTIGSTSAGATFTVAREKAPRWLPNEMSSREAANFWRKHVEYSRKAELGKWIPDSIRECVDPVILIMVANFRTTAYAAPCSVEEVTDARVRAFIKRSAEPTCSVKNGWKGRLAKVVRNVFVYQDSMVTSDEWNAVFIHNDIGSHRNHGAKVVFVVFVVVHFWKKMNDRVKD